MNIKSISQNIKIQHIVLLQLLFLFTNCNNKPTDDDFDYLPRGSLTIAGAKQWFDANLQPVINANQTFHKDNNGTFFDLKPLFNWNLAELNNNQDWSVVELQWEYEGKKFAMAIKDTIHGSNPNPEATAQVVRLVILKNLKNGKMYGFKMVVLPDPGCMQYGTNLQANKYLSKESDFSGVVLFYSVLDEFVNGWKYENGCITGKILENMTKKGGIDGEITLKKTMYLQFIPIETCWWQIVQKNSLSFTFLGCVGSGGYWIQVIGNNNGWYYPGWYYPATGGGGGSGTNNPVELIPALNALFVGGATNLSPNNIDSLNTAFLQMNAKCIFSHITNYLQSNNITLGSISIDLSMLGVAGIGPQGNLKFGHSDFITEHYLSHEWVHVGQRKISGININSLENLGMAEFETLLLFDILETIRLGGNFGYTNHSFACFNIESDSLRVPYTNWLKGLTANGTQYPASINPTEFFNWANTFGDVTKQSYYKKSNGRLYTNTDYYPSTLITLFQNCNTNN